MKDKITIKSIAKHFNCSVSTVSRAINNSGYVKKELKEAIIEYGVKYNWQASNAARSLKNGKTKTIMFLSSRIPAYNIETILKDIVTNARQKGFHIFLSQYDSNEEQVTELESYLGRGLDAVIVAFPRKCDHMEHILQQLNSTGTQVITIGKNNMSFSTSISYDFKAQGYMAMNKLIASGHDKIAYFGMFEDQRDIIEKLQTRFYPGVLIAKGIMEAAQEAGVTFSPETDIVSDCFHNYSYLKKVLDQQRYTAFICETAELLCHFYGICRDKKINIPEDVSVVGLGENDFFAGFNPVPAYVDDCCEKIGKKVISIITDKRKANIKKQQLIQPIFTNGGSMKRINSEL